MRVGRSLLVLGAAAIVCTAAGCGSDSSGESTSSNPATQVSIPTPTSPIPTTTTATTASTTAGGGKKKGQTTTASAAPAACTVPDAYQDFKYTGIDCTAAVAVATAWDQDGKDCNTVDNPNVDEGYHRTCSVESFSCTAKRDVHSDGRFVTCTQGGQSIRFTWLPA
jgi:hypothetical protein